MFKLFPRRAVPGALGIGIVLFVTLGGTATATVLLTGKDIKNHSLTRADIARETIQSHNIQDGHVMLRDLAPNVQSTLKNVATPGANGNDGTNGAKGNEGANGAKGNDGANGAKGNDGATGPEGLQGDTGRKGDSGENGVSGAAWGNPVNQWTAELATYNAGGTDVAQGTITLEEGATGFTLTGTVQPSNGLVNTSAIANCGFKVDGTDVPDTNWAQTYLPAGMPVYTAVQLTVLAMVPTGVYSAGQHTVKLNCYSSTPGLLSAGANFTAVYANKTDITGTPGPGI
jgi:hypothetical protein